MVKKPYADTRLVKFISERVKFLQSRKTQSDISAEAGFKSLNMVAQVKSGASRLPIGRVPALARALECDPGELMLLALEQNQGQEYRLIEEILRTAITRNEADWIDALRAASGGSDPALTDDALAVLRSLFENRC